MDMYKKKNLKLDKGLSKQLRVLERSTARAESRHNRLSILRCFEDEDAENQPTEKNEAVSRIPTIGKPNLKAPTSRLEMLQKWKAEKLMKRELELKSKKPTFKAGIIAPKPVSVLPSGIKATNTTPSKTDSRLKASVSRIRFDDKFKSIKETSVQPSFSSKSQAISKNLKLLNNKESSMQSSNRKIPATGSSSLKTKQEIQTRMPIKSQIVPKKTSYTTTKEVNSKESSMQSSNRKIPATGSSSLKTKQLPSLSVVPPKLPVSKSLKPPQLNSCGIGKGPAKTATQMKQTGIPLKNIVPKPQNKNVSKIDVPAKKNDVTSDITFSCDISHIAPSEDKPAAPKGFIFQPPTDLSFSFLEDGISSIFSKIRAGTERTSTPMRADIRRIEEENSEKSSTVTRGLDEVFSPPLQNTESNHESKSESNREFSETKTKEKVCVPIDATSDFGEKEKTSLADRECPKESPKQSGIIKLTGEKNSNAAEKIVENKLEIGNQDPVLNVLEVSLPIFEKSPLLKDLTSPKFPVQQKIDLHEKQDPVNLHEDSLSVFEGTIPESSHQPKSDLLNDKVPIISPIDFPEDTKPVGLKDLPKQEFNFENPKIQVHSMSLPEASLTRTEERNPLLNIEIPSNTTKLQKKDSLSENEESIISRRPFTRSSEIKTRSFRRSEMPALESINESLENCSLLESPPKPHKKGPLKKSILQKDFTPRRSLRLAKFSETDSPENLFDVRPSLCATPTDSKNGACSSSLTYDFDKLHLEMPSNDVSKTNNEQPPVAARRQSTRKGKVSLLYTPPPKGRVSTMRKSIKGDLMSFSPDV